MRSAARARTHTPSWQPQACAATATARCHVLIGHCRQQYRVAYSMAYCGRRQVLAHTTAMETYAPLAFRPPLPHLHRDWGSPLPHLHRDWAHAYHICTGTGLLLRSPSSDKTSSFTPVELDLRVLEGTGTTLGTSERRQHMQRSEECMPRAPSHVRHATCAMPSAAYDRRRARPVRLAVVDYCSTALARTANKHA